MYHPKGYLFIIAKLKLDMIPIATYNHVTAAAMFYDR